jgi:hypothetical protein
MSEFLNMKISIKSAVASLLFVGAGFVAQTASAANVDNTYNITFPNSYAVISGDFAGNGTTFTDHYKFTVGASDLDAGFYANQGKIVGLDISRFELVLAGGGLVASGTGASGSWNIASTLLAPGSYILEVAGKVTGSISGNYNGTLNVSPVPEPETYGMMLAGLALVGVVARRKAKKAA